MESIYIKTNTVRKDELKPIVVSVPQKGIDAVGFAKGETETTLSSSALAQKHWYIAVVNNKSEKLCRDRLENRIAHQPKGEKDYEVYVALQKEMRIQPDGKRKRVERILFPALLFIRCTEVMRRKEIVHLPYIKRFMVNIAERKSGGGRPVAVIPDDQMAKLRRMIDEADEPIVVDSSPISLGTRVRINGGKLAGLEGNVLETPEGNTYFVIRVEMLGCARVCVARDLLDVLD